MTVESMAPIGALLESDQLMNAAKPEAPAAGFGEWFTNELNAVNDRLIGVDHSMQQLAVGGTQVTVLVEFMIGFGTPTSIVAPLGMEPTVG